MPTLAELKTKWFIPMDGSAPNHVPCRRHTDIAGADALSVSTDGNTVTHLIDGELYQRQWHDAILALVGAASAELYHGGWRFEDVFTLGRTVGGPTALDDVIGAQAGGVSTYPLLCCNMGVRKFNKPSVATLRAGGVTTACRDNRFPPIGSNHQKFAVMKDAAGAMAVLGSIDVSKSRWDTSAHLAANADRDPVEGKQTHDTGVLITGPAVVDIEKTYRERWNDSSRTFGLQPLRPAQPLITTPYAAPGVGGTHSIQVLRTYGITSTFFGYSWSPRGEFTAWASYLNAMKNAARYIYIEDQYFLPFDWPPCFDPSRAGPAQDTDLIYQLGEAMRRGVDVAILTPSNAEDSAHMFQKYHRDLGVNYLMGIAAEGRGTVVVASMQTGGSDVYVHSKLMIVDDEFVCIGSANVGQRSMTFDSELHVGIVDSANTFAKELRKAIWAELTGRTPASLDNPVTAYADFAYDVSASAGHLKPYPVDTLAVYPHVPGATTPPPIGHAVAIREIDPYAGPPGLR